MLSVSAVTIFLVGEETYSPREGLKNIRVLMASKNSILESVSNLSLLDENGVMSVGELLLN